MNLLKYKMSEEKKKEHMMRLNKNLTAVMALAFRVKVHKCSYSNVSKLNLQRMFDNIQTH